MSDLKNISIKHNPDKVVQMITAKYHEVLDRIEKASNPTEYVEWAAKPIALLTFKTMLLFKKIPVASVGVMGRLFDALERQSDILLEKGDEMLSLPSCTQHQKDVILDLRLVGQEAIEALEDRSCWCFKPASNRGGLFYNKTRNFEKNLKSLYGWFNLYLDGWLNYTLKHIRKKETSDRF